MLSVFQIFKMLLGVIVFIFVITFFLRVSDMYSGLGESRIDFETVDSLDKAVMQTYTSGNPTTFMVFRDFEVLLYDAPKVKFDAGQKTLSAPVFMIPDNADIVLERRCDDYGWFRFCWVFGHTDTTKIVFAPVENTPESRGMMVKIVNALPDGFEFGYCNASEKPKKGGKDDFLGFVSEMDGKYFQDCELPLPENTVLITMGSTGSIAQNELVISGYTVKDNSTWIMQERTFSDDEIIPMVTGGIPALDYKRELFERDLKAASRIMMERTKLVYEKTIDYNVQPCPECVTPYPKECGWVDYDGHEWPSTKYLGFISTLTALHGMVDSGDYMAKLEESEQAYEALKDAGCEE
jgi:hypothetical protein